MRKLLHISTLTLFAFLWLLSPMAAWAQEVSEEEVEEMEEEGPRFASERDSLFFYFPETFNRFMGFANQPGARQAGLNLLRHWDDEFGKLDSLRKDALFRISYTAWNKKFEASPDFTVFFGIVFSALDDSLLSETQLDRFLDISERVIDKADRYKWNQFSNRINQFYRSKSLFASSANSLLLDEPEFELFWHEAGLSSQAPLFAYNEKDETHFNLLTKDKLALLGDQGTPAISIGSSNLRILKGRDTLDIIDTRGTWFILEDLWLGKGGSSQWTMAGFDSAAVWTVFDDYIMKTGSPELLAENTTFYYPEKLREPAKGSFEYRTIRTPEGKFEYPRFSSYSRNIELRILSETEFVYRGGISLKGKTMVSSLEKGQEASIEVYRGKELRLRATARTILFEDSLVTSPNARFVAYHSGDSLYHNSVQFRYKPYHSELTMVRDKSAFRYSPYVSNHFRVDISAELVRWNTAEDEIKFFILNSRDVVPAVVESHDFFDKATYNKLGEFYEFNPLLIAVTYARDNNKGGFYADELVSRTGRSRDVILNAMARLASMGFIDYDPDTGWMQILRKGYHYVLASTNRKDWDRILIPSITEAGPNVVLDIGQNNLQVNGVRQFFISEEKDIYIRPRNRQVVLTGNRDMAFTGAINTGNYEFAGQDIKFSYDEFKVDLPKIDTLSMSVVTQSSPNQRTAPEKQKVNNQLRQTSGSIVLDDPKNKSSFRSSPSFPAFAANESSLVYFNNLSILNGAYDESIFFEIPPFKIDGTANPESKATSFQGTFYGGTLIDDFETELVIKPDLSFGFDQAIGAEGLGIYGGKGKVFSRVSMDGDGLRGLGRVEIFGGMFDEGVFTLYPDSLSAQSSSFDFPGQKKGQLDIPPMKGFASEMKWNVKGDSLKLNSDSLFFDLFGGKVAFSGELYVTSRGTLAEGALRISDGLISGENLKMGKNFISAENAAISIESDIPDFPLMTGKGFKVEYIDEQRSVLLKPENGISEMLDFPFTLMTTEVAEARWNIDRNVIEMKSPVDILDGTAKFVATRDNGEKMIISAAGAEYDLNTKSIRISGISKIPVADAYVIPSGGALSVKETGDLQEFKGASIVLDTLNEYHRIVDADVSILSKTRFMATGFYEYKNETGKSFRIPFDQFEWRAPATTDRRILAPKPYTFGAGVVLEKDNLEISPKVFFKGDVFMYSYKPALEMDGFIKLALNSFPQNRAWIQYKSDGESKGIQIDLEKSVTEFGNPVSAGLHVGNTGIYGTFISDKKDQFDHDLFRPKGQLSFDPAKNEYLIRDEKAFNEMALAQTFLALNDENGDVRFEGKFDFLEKTTPIKITGAGKGSGNLKTNVFDLNTTLHIDLNIPATLLDTLGRDFRQVAEFQGMEPALLDRTSVAYGVAHLIGETAARKWEQGSILQSTPLFQAAAQLAKGMVLTNMEMKWSPSQKAFYSTGDAGISHMNRKDVNVNAKVYLEIKKTGLGDVVNLLIRLSNNAWAFFRLEDNNLTIYSASNEMNSFLDAKSNLFTAKGGELVYQRGELRDAQTFANHFLKTYLGITEALKLDLSTAAIEQEKKVDKKTGF